MFCSALSVLTHLAGRQHGIIALACLLCARYTQDVPIQADDLFLEAVLVGLQQKRAEVEERIAELKQQIGDGARPKSATPVRKRRRMSAAGRARIRAALKKRWAEFRQKKAAGSTQSKRRVAGISRTRG